MEVCEAKHAEVSSRANICQIVPPSQYHPSERAMPRLIHGVVLKVASVVFAFLNHQLLIFFGRVSAFNFHVGELIINEITDSAWCPVCRPQLFCISNHGTYASVDSVLDECCIECLCLTEPICSRRFVSLHLLVYVRRNPPMAHFCFLKFTFFLLRSACVHRLLSL